MQPLYIFDLDGTLALIEHRRHFVTAPMIIDTFYERTEVLIKHPDFKPDWKAFYAACVDDKPNWPVIRTLRSLLRAGNQVWIWSGRSDEVREQTTKWIEDNVLPSIIPMGAPRIALSMRKEGDYTPDEQLKEQWLKALKALVRKRLTAVFDDRQKVVDMWRRNGVVCFQVAPGDF